MTIEELTGLDTEALDALSKDETLLEKHLGWCLNLTRPERLAKREPSLNKKQSVIAKAQQGELEAAKEFARKQAEAMGIKLNI